MSVILSRGGARHNRRRVLAHGPSERTTYSERVSRRGPGWVPNQHGAWAMLATPLLVGILASRPAWAHLPLAATWFVGYFAFFAAGLWLKARRRPRYLPPVRAYAVGAALAGALTLVMRPDVLRWAPLFVLPLGIGLAASALRDDRSLWSGLTTTAGSALMTPVAYDVGGGTNWHRAWVLAAVLALYFAGTVVYVKTMIRERGEPAFLALSVGFHLAATLAMIWVHPALVAVFALLTLRTALLARMTLSPKAVGIGEIFATVVVAVIALLVVD